MIPIEAITTLATVPAVIALVTLFKDLGLPSKLGPLAAVVLGVLLSVLSALAVGPITANWYETVSVGVILGLSASGLYDGAKAISPRLPEAIVVSESPETYPERRD